MYKGKVDNIHNENGILKKILIEELRYQLIVV